ncbi:MAG: NAD(P)H-binding protein [Pseudomonadota bacterium]
MTQTVLILGARGRFGRHACAAFAEAGWHVRALARGATALPQAHETVAADITDAEALTRAARGADVILHAVNPPYPAWSRELPRQTAAVLAAAKGSGATVLIPGNVYPYGSAMPEVLTEATRFAPDTRKGRLRAEMEAAFRDAAADGVRTILLRAGDFLDTEIAGNWFDSHMTAKLDRGEMMYPGPLDRVHAWASLPDATRAAAALAGRRAELPPFFSAGFEGHSVTGAELVAAVERAAGRKLRLRSMPWTAVRLMAPFWPMGREVLEMRYLWDTPHRIDGAELREVLPDPRLTPLDEAVRAAVAPRLKAPEPA